MYALVIAGGIGLGLLVRPLVQGGSISDLFGGGNSNTNSSTLKIRCPGPESSELALSEYTERASNVDASAQVLTQHRYQLERPGQPTLGFEGLADDNTFSLECSNIRFGPGPRVAFSRGQESIVVELVGPSVRVFDANKNPDLAALAVEPRWKLGLKLSEYKASAPMLDSEGRRGTLTLERGVPASGLPQKLVLETEDGGATYKLNRAASGL